jgi:hypothetical protein
MRFDPLELEALKSQLTQDQSPKQYCSRAADSIATMLSQDSQAWKRFGPYWPWVQSLLANHRPDVATNWGDRPDYLAHYDLGDEMLETIAALRYLNRDGDYLAPLGSPHSIEMPDGSNALYDPELGIIEG